MLIRQIFLESEIKTNIVNDLMDFLLVYSQSPKKKIKLKGPNGAITYLRNLGYSVDEDTMLQLLDDPIFDTVVERSDSDFITLKSDELDATVAPDEMESSQDKVDQAAARVADKTVKSGDNL